MVSTCKNNFQEDTIKELFDCKNWEVYLSVYSDCRI